MTNIYNILKFSIIKKDIISYYFVGKQNNVVESILINIEKNNKINEKDRLLLNEIFNEKNVEKWLNSKYTVKFIYDFINNKV